MILSLDVGTVESGYALVEMDTYKPIQFGKISNEDLLKLVQTLDYTELIYEEFQSYGNMVGKSTITSITWNGRYIQTAHDRNKKVTPIYRKDVKINLCGTMRSKDKDIRQALIDRFGVVGRKNEQGYFYGFKSDIWSAYALAVTYLDKEKHHE